MSQTPSHLLLENPDAFTGFSPSVKSAELLQCCTTLEKQGAHITPQVETIPLRVL